MRRVLMAATAVLGLLGATTGQVQAQSMHHGSSVHGSFHGSGFSGNGFRGNGFRGNGFRGNGFRGDGFRGRDGAFAAGVVGFGLGAALGEVWFSDGLAIATVTPEVNWKRRLTQRNNLKLILGLTFAHTEAVGLDVKDPLAPGGSAVSPIGSFQLSSRLLGSRGITLQSDVNGGVDYYVDPVLGTALPRAEAAIGATLIAVPTWMVILQGSFATALKTPPPLTVVGQTLSILPDETVFSVSLSGRRRISENFFAELGGLYADRGPVLSTPDFRFHQRQLWINFALTGTTRPISRQTLQQEQP